MLMKGYWCVVASHTLNPLPVQREYKPDKQGSNDGQQDQAFKGLKITGEFYLLTLLDKQ